MRAHVLLSSQGKPLSEAILDLDDLLMFRLADMVKHIVSLGTPAADIDEINAKLVKESEDENAELL